MIKTISRRFIFPACCCFMCLCLAISCKITFTLRDHKISRDGQSRIFREADMAMFYQARICTDTCKYVLKLRDPSWAIFNRYLSYLIFLELRSHHVVELKIAFCCRSASQNTRPGWHLREDRKSFDVDVCHVARSPRSGNGSLVSRKSGGGDIIAIRKRHRNGASYNCWDGMEWCPHVEVRMND